MPVSIPQAAEKEETDMAKKVPASLKDREKSYYKYYAQDIAAAPQEKYDMITPEPGDNAKALRI